MKNKILITLLFLMLLLIACNLTQILPGEPEATPTAALEPTETSTPDPTETPTPEPTEAPTLEEAAYQVINALAVMDMETVADFVHPEKGVRFSPYTYVEEEHLVFSAEELPDLVGLNETFTWGQFDGTGDPINMTFDEYYDRFIYSADFADPEAMAVNEELGWSSMINNIDEFYPGSSFVEYHFSGFDEQYGGLDWVSLRLVFIQEDGVWFLVGVVKDQWTI